MNLTTLRLPLLTACLASAPFTASAQDEGDEPPPRTWAEVGPRYTSECPSPLFTLEKPETVTVAGHVFELRGSDMVRTGGAWKGPLKVGVLGAVKDASAETRENLKRAVAEFDKRGVQVVVANGDISEGEFNCTVISSAA